MFRVSGVVSCSVTRQNVSSVDDSVQDACDTTRGATSIEQEHVGADDRFVVHDSCGFETAERHNLDIACDFISRRKSMHQLKDRLHAVL